MQGDGRQEWRSAARSRNARDIMSRRTRLARERLQVIAALKAPAPAA
jgi:hypothetical protein